MSAGVYQIVAPSGRRYIGSAVNFDSRWRVHRHHLRKGTHHSMPLQAAWNKYGSQLRFEKLLICNRENVVFYEQIAIDGLHPEMNVSPTAGNSLGYKHTPETKEKFHKRKTRSYSDEHKEALRNRMKALAKTRTPEWYAWRASKVVHKPWTAERLEAHGKARLGKKLGPMSDEHKAKIGDANRGRRPCALAIAKSIETRKGIKQSPEHIAKRVASLKATCAKRNGNG